VYGYKVLHDPQANLTLQALKYTFWNPRQYLVIALLFVTQSTFGQITGSFFKDFNGDGQWQQRTEPPAAGIVVDAYDGNNTLVASAVASTNRSYILLYTVPVRVEFIIGSGACVYSRYCFKV
jgi:hypothetical protein